MSDPIGYGGSYIGDLEDHRRASQATKHHIATLESQLAEANTELRRLTDLIQRFNVEPGKLSDWMHAVVNGLESQRNKLRKKLAEAKGEAERLRTTIDTQGREHDSADCGYGSLCPWCEIERLRRWVNDLQSGMCINCVYCGHWYGLQSEVPASMADVLKEHITKCPKHPLAAANERAERLEREVGRLRTAAETALDDYRASFDSKARRLHCETIIGALEEALSTPTPAAKESEASDAP